MTFLVSSGRKDGIIIAAVNHVTGFVIVTTAMICNSHISLTRSRWAVTTVTYSSDLPVMQLATLLAYSGWPEPSMCKP